MALHVWLLLACCALASAQRTLRDVASVNHHWAKDSRFPSAAEWEAFKDLGIKRARTGFTWSHVEHQKGVYNWTFYDAFTKQIHDENMGTLWCVHPLNPIYNASDKVPTDPEAIEAFARFLTTAVERYNIPNVTYWELSNEPNLGKNSVNPAQYLTFVKTAVGMVRNNSKTKDAFIVGPALAMGPPVVPATAWLEAAADDGLFDLIDYVTVHWYRSDQPESAVALDSRPASVSGVRQMIQQRTARNVDVISGEWGYPTSDPATTFHPVDEVTQANYLIRMWLSMFAANVPLANWYDWIEDCDDNSNRECRFGIVHPNASAKPAYSAAKTTLSVIGDSHLDFTGHWPARGGTVLSFDQQSKFAVWLNVNTNYTKPVTEQVSFTGIPNACYDAVGVLGTFSAKICADSQGFMSVNASGTPILLKQN